MGVPKALTPGHSPPGTLLSHDHQHQFLPHNDFHYSYLRTSGSGRERTLRLRSKVPAGAIEPLGEKLHIVLSPYNVNAQNIRTRIWDGKDNFFADTPLTS